ncbi:MAG: hypothetical protein FRX48_06486 [Lasallia pustulata]|uniref:Uncharacterized protein n=1 Tax=Lasallia pustulata TaxID=136370 RepID=A0A5M8PK95_9LECA|nr:MAG: hypothetical protein FRX48_06486 [Lasallia pustulata]
MDFELDEPTMDSNYDDYYDASEGGDPQPAAPPEDSEGGPVVKVEDLEEHEVKETRGQRGTATTARTASSGK